MGQTHMPLCNFLCRPTASTGAPAPTTTPHSQKTAATHGYKNMNWFVSSPANREYKDDTCAAIYCPTHCQVSICLPLIMVVLRPNMS